MTYKTVEDRKKYYRNKLANMSAEELAAYRERSKTQSRKRRQDPLYKKNFNEYMKKYRQDHDEYRERQNKLARKKIFEMRQKCIFHYSLGTMKCACCGENTFHFLDIDHVNNDGSKWREIHGKGGITFYTWLINNSFPDEPKLQVLCANCNAGKARNGGVCPHRVK